MQAINGSFDVNLSLTESDVGVLYYGFNGFGITWSYLGIHVALFFVACVGVILNSITVYVLGTKTQTMDVSRIFILNLGCSDLLTDLTCIYVIAYNLMHYKDYYECVIRSGLVTCVNLNSALHLLSLTFDRYFKITCPYNYVHVFKEQWAKKYCACVWIFCGFLSALPILGWRQWSKYGRYYCSYFGVMSRTYLIFISTLFLLTFLFMLFCYGSIWLVAIKQNTKVFSSQTSGPSVRDTGLWMRPTKTVLTLVSFYACCWLPFGIVAFLHLTDGFPPGVSNDRKGVFAAYSSFSVFLNTIANPVIYVRRIKTVRLKIMTMLLSPYGKLYGRFVTSRRRVAPLQEEQHTNNANMECHSV